MRAQSAMALLSAAVCASAAFAVPNTRLEQPHALRPAPSTIGRSTLLSTQQQMARRPQLLSAAKMTETASGGTATVTSSVINLSKNIVGSGVLALAGGMAAFSSSKMAVLPAVLILFFLCAVSGYAFSLIARLGDEVGADTYRDVWVKVFGEKLAILPSLTVAFKTGVGGLAYAIILGDSFKSIAMLAKAPAWLCSSNMWIYILSATVLLPLSLMRDLSSLAFGSVIGTAGTLYTAVFMWLRLAGGQYAAGGKFHELIAESARPAFAASTAAKPLLNPAVFVLVSMLSTAFLAHYNAPKFYKELATPTDGSTKGAAFNKVCIGAFGIAAFLCSSIMVGGFLTFGGASQGLILNSYATTDPLAFIARLGICASIIFSYPLNFVGLRDGVLNMLGLSGAASKPSVHILATVALLCAVNGLALVVKDLGLVVSIGGALLGSALVYVFPAAMFIQATRNLSKKLQERGESLPAGRRNEMFANVGLAGLGVSLGVLGVFKSLQKAGIL